MFKKMVNVLGTEYTIDFVKEFPEHMSDFQETSEAVCNFYDKIIYVRYYDGNDITEIGKKEINKKNLRHEIVHAFLFESGLSSNTYECIGAWAEHEEMVDWFAIQSPKIFKVFRELNIL